MEKQVDALVGEYKLELDDSRHQVILMTGRSGVGKSTLTQVLFGDLNSLESSFDELYLCNKIKNVSIEEDPNQEEHSMFQSDTICPQLFTYPDQPGIAIYDCPGFADTRGTSNEISTGVYLSQIVQHATHVKIVAVVDYDTVKPNADRSKFTNSVLPEILDFVLNNDIYEGGVFLLVSKYANPHDTGNQFDDAQIVSSTATFLQDAQKHAALLSTDENRKTAIKALFEKSWLKTVDGKYLNIGFSRTITGEGKLSDMEHLTRRSELRKQLLDNPSFMFKPANRQDFGCPISEAAKLEIRKILVELGDGVKENLDSVGQKVVRKFVEAAGDHANLSSFVKQYDSYLNDKKELTQEKSGLTVKSVKVLRKFCNNIKADTATYMDKLRETVTRMRYLSSVDVKNTSKIWEHAHSKWNEAMMKMANDLLAKFREAQGNLATELDSVLKQVMKKFTQSTNNSLFNQSDLFTNNLKKMTKEESGLTNQSLEVLRTFGVSIGIDLETELDKLAGIISSLKYLTNVDGEQSSATLMDVHTKWFDAMEYMKKDIDQVKAQKDLAAAQRAAAAAAAAFMLMGAYGYNKNDGRDVQSDCEDQDHCED